MWKEVEQEELEMMQAVKKQPIDYFNVSSLLCVWSASISGGKSRA